VDIVAVVAAYAALISTLALVWQVFTWQRSRDKIKISAEIVECDTDKPAMSRAECICKIVNSGGQPVSLLEIWMESTNPNSESSSPPGRRNLGGVNLPLFLSPGQCHFWRFSTPRGDNLRFVAKDARGKIYTCECGGK
jgi:hypothetical protein